LNGSRADREEVTSGSTAGRRGCRRPLLIGAAIGLGVLVILLLGVWYWTRTDNFAELVRVRVERTLESRLGREVNIRRVTIVPGRQTRIVLEDLTIANVPGSSRQYFAVVPRVEIVGGIGSFLNRTVHVGRVDVFEPAIFFEIFPEGAEFDHNWPRWSPAPPRGFQIVRFDAEMIAVHSAAFEMLDRRREMRFLADRLDAEVTADVRNQIYYGQATSPSLTMQIQQYEPFSVTLSGGFHYEPGALELRSIALRGEGIDATVAGRIDPLTEGVYDLDVRSVIELARVRQIFDVAQELEGRTTIAGRISGRGGEFQFRGNWQAPQLAAAGYDLADLAGTFEIDNARAVVDIAEAAYGGGTLTGRYVLAQYAEPRPMSIRADFNRVAIERIFADFGVEGIGLRGAATGSIEYAWSGNQIAEGSGQGRATLAPGAVAFSDAPYPMPVRGDVVLAINRGVLTFRDSWFSTPSSRIALAGTLRLEDLASNLRLTIDSSDFGELDRLGVNIARGAGQAGYDVLGIGGAGRITGSVTGTLRQPQVAAQVRSTGTRYNDILLGAGDIALRYDFGRELLTFERARFDLEGSVVVFSGTVAFIDGGPRFDLDVTATDYSVERVLHAVGLDEVDLQGSATGRLTVAGTPDRGEVRFHDLTVRDGAARADVGGVLRWLPGEGNLAFDLNLNVDDWPIEQALELVNLELPLTGLATGALTISGSAQTGTVEFRGVTLRDGAARAAITGQLRWLPGEGNITFDLALDLVGWPVEDALALANLDLELTGLATGRVRLTGTPGAGEARFDGMTVVDGRARLSLDGLIAWAPGERNLTFDLALGVQDYPMSALARFLDLETLPVTGLATGSLRLEGPLARLSGAGSVVVRDGTVYGEPFEITTADILLQEGVVRLPHFEVRLPAGVIAGVVEFDLTTQQFAVDIQTADIDIDRVGLLEPLARMLGGRLRIVSTGVGTLERPEFVLEAVIEDARIRGFDLPVDAAPPRLYIALREGRLIVRGDAFGVMEIEGEGTVSPEGDLDGLIRVGIVDLGDFLEIVAPGTDVTAAAPLVADLHLGGNIASLETLRIDAIIHDTAVIMAGRRIQTAEPIRLTMAGGEVTIDSMRLRTNGSIFTVTGSAGLTGERQLGLDAVGRVEAALLQILVPDVQAAGFVDVALQIAGTMEAPSFNGTAQVLNGEVRLPGFPQPITEVNGAFIFRGNVVEVDALRATIGGGAVTAGGTIVLDGLTPQQVTISFIGEEVSLRYFEGITIDGNFRLQLSGDAERYLLQGNVDVARAIYTRDFDYRASLLNVLLERRGVLPTVAAAWQDRVGLDIRLDARDALAVRNNIANVTGSAELDIRGTLANPVAIGAVTLDEGGTVTFQDVNYRLLRGSILFQNPFVIDPYFDVTFEGRMAEYDLTINLTGTLERLQPVITSDPPAGDLTLLTLFTGTLGPDGMRGIGIETLPTAGASLLLQTLGEAIGTRILPFADSVRLDPGLMQSSDPMVTFEKRVTADLRAIVSYSTNNNRNIVIIEWQVTPDWVLVLTSDNQRQTGAAREYFVSAVAADARFRRRYLGQFGGRRTVEPDEQAAAGPPPVVTISAEPEILFGAAVPGELVVRSVSFRADARIETTRLPELVAVEPGGLLSIRDVQRSIKSLFATGDFGDVRVEAQEEGDFVDVTFLLSVNYRVGEIRFEGVGGDDRARAEREMQIRRGQVFSLSAVDRGAVAIQNRLMRRGYMQVTADPEVRFSRIDNRADVIYHIDLGPRARIGTIAFDGDIAPFEYERLLRELRLRPGDSYRLLGAREAAERLQRWMWRQDRRRAQVRFVEGVYNPESATVDLQYRVFTGPIVTAELEGAPLRPVRRIIPFGRFDPYTPDILARTVDNLIVHFQQRGYFFVEADVREVVEGDLHRVIFEVSPGQQVRLNEVDFRGNEQIPDEELRRLIGTGPVGAVRGLFGTLFRRPQGVTQQQINADRDVVEAHYRISGFSEAAVSTPFAERLSGNRINVVFPIREGVQTLVEQVGIEGNEAFDREALPRLSLRPGDPLNPIVVNRDLIALQSFYAEDGYVEIQVQPVIELGADRSSATVIYRISEGPRVLIDDVVTRGNTYTRDRVIQRTAALQEGQPFSYRALLEAQRNLQRLAIFNRIEVFPERAGTTAGERDIVLEVEEGRNLSIAGALGYSTDQLARGTLSVAHRNLFGTGRYVGIETRLSQRENKYFLHYREPLLFLFDSQLELAVYRERERRTELELVKLGTWAEVSRVFRETLRASLRYEYRRVECVGEVLCIRDFPIPGLPLQDQEIEISSIAPAVFIDRRDDPITPFRGFYGSGAVEYAFPLFAAETTFLKGFAQGAWYRPLTDRSLIVLSGRAGAIQPIGGSQIPFAERFFAGGETSHRAFRLDRLGRVGETLILIPRQNEEGNELIPVGGNAMTVLNAEYRFPVFGNLRGAFFVDAGNVWSELGDFDLGDLRYGVGVGVRYLTPVGPLRLDFGYKLDRIDLEPPYALSISIGFPF
jgi:outer membrane protein insertion porin family